jgi:hypothetical protein
VIIIGGMKRSGSTWQYNVVRLIMENSQMPFKACGDNEVMAQNYKGETLLKHHWHRGRLAARANLVLTSHRNVIQVCASMSHLLGRPVTGEELAKIVEHWRRWDRISNYRLEYERIAEEPLKVVREIVQLLGVGVDPRWITNEVQALRPPSEGKDPTTLLFHNHRRPT